MSVFLLRPPTGSQSTSAAGRHPSVERQRATLFQVQIKLVPPESDSSLAFTAVCRNFRQYVGKKLPLINAESTQPIYKLNSVQPQLVGFYSAYETSCAAEPLRQNALIYLCGVSQLHKPLNERPVSRILQAFAHRPST